MAFTQAQLDALEEAIATGSRRVKYADKEVEYASLTEMLRVRDLIRKSLGQVATNSTRFKVSASKGIGGCDE